MPLGYIIANDQYFKRDDVGIIYQMNVAPGKQRGFVGASLLKAQFERSAYGCKLYCCWCAQDIAANQFWEAMGFVPLAFRSGSRTKGAGERRACISSGRSGFDRAIRPRRFGFRRRRRADRFAKTGSCCRSRRARTGATQNH